MTAIIRNVHEFVWNSAPYQIAAIMGGHSSHIVVLFLLFCIVSGYRVSRQQDDKNDQYKSRNPYHAKVAPDLATGLPGCFQVAKDGVKSVGSYFRDEMMMMLYGFCRNIDDQAKGTPQKRYGSSSRGLSVTEEEGEGAIDCDVVAYNGVAVLAESITKEKIRQALRDACLEVFSQKEVIKKQPENELPNIPFWPDMGFQFRG
jgi:hypothetical protein